MAGDNMADPAKIIDFLWEEITKSGFERVRIDEGRHPVGHKINVGYGSGAVRVRIRPAEDSDDVVIDINLFADADTRRARINLVLDELAMVRGEY